MNGASIQRRRRRHIVVADLPHTLPCRLGQIVETGTGCGLGLGFRLLFRFGEFRLGGGWLRLGFGSDRRRFHLIIRLRII